MFISKDYHAGTCIANAIIVSKQMSFLTFRNRSWKNSGYPRCCPSYGISLSLGIGFCTKVQYAHRDSDNNENHEKT